MMHDKHEYQQLPLIEKFVTTVATEIGTKIFCCFWASRVKQLVACFQLRKRLYNHKCLSVCLSILKTPFNLNPSSLNILPSSFNLHPSSFNFHPSSFNLHPSSFIIHLSSFISQLLSFFNKT